MLGALTLRSDISETVPYDRDRSKKKKWTLVILGVKEVGRHSAARF